MGNINRREKALIFIVAALALFYVYYNFFLSPLKLQYDTINQAIADKKATLASIEKLKITNKADAEKLNALKVKYQEALKALPQDARDPEIVYNLDTLAVKSNTKISSIVFAAGTSNTSQKAANTENSAASSASNNTAKTNTIGSNMNVLPVTLNLSGDYASVLTFINLLENDTRINEIQSINLAQGGDKNLQVTIITNYYFTAATPKVSQSYDFKDGNAGKGDLFN
jgi:hypothetical protein